MKLIDSTYPESDNWHIINATFDELCAFILKFDPNGYERLLFKAADGFNRLSWHHTGLFLVSWEGGDLFTIAPLGCFMINRRAEVERHCSGYRQWLDKGGGND